MRRIRFLFACVTFFSLVLLGCSAATSSTTPADSTATKEKPTSQVQFVTVAPDVKLEVLDWGGSGDPVVFLSGLGDNAHVFDEFAPALTDQFHVYGITRRGFGASSQPADGYDIATRVEDIRRVLDELHLDRVSLVGHSIAGDELTRFAGEFPDRVVRLVYLDAAYDHASIVDAKSLPWPFPDPPTPPWWKVIEGCGHPDYSKVQAPALSINMTYKTVAEYFDSKAWESWDDATHARMAVFYEALKPAFDSRVEFKKVANGRIVEIPNSTHYLYMTNRDEVLRITREFLTSGK